MFWNSFPSQMTEASACAKQTPTQGKVKFCFLGLQDFLG